MCRNSGGHTILSVLFLPSAFLAASFRLKAQKPSTSGEDTASKLLSTYLAGWPEMHRSLDPNPAASVSGSSWPFGTILLPLSCSPLSLLLLLSSSGLCSLIPVGLILQMERFIREKEKEDYKWRRDREANGGRTIGSDIAVEGREIKIKATFALVVGVRVKQPRVNISRAVVSLAHHPALSNKVTFLPQVSSWLLLWTMSMILFACVVRVRDGLPLSASTDFYHTQDFLECRRRLKTLALRLAQYPGRGSAEGLAFSIQ